jgi:hypothetical protein
MNRLVVVLAVSALGLLACEAPPVYPGSDKRQNSHSGRIEGEVVVSSAARGNVVLFLFDAARPPPPVGTGRPLTFTVVSREAVFGAAADGDSGPFTAPFAFSLVGEGKYLIRGFIDANADFIPWYGVTAEVNAGDVGGGAVDPITHAVRVVEVGVDAAGHPLAVVDVPVSFSDTARVPVDRPAFSLPSSVVLGAAPVTTTLTVQPISDGVVQQRAPVFLARLVDEDGDGVPDDANKDGTPDFWPRVVVRKLSEKSDLVDENDLDKNGVLDTEPGFADYEHINPTTGELIAADDKPDLVVLAAGFDFSALLPSLLDTTGRVKLTPTPVTSLKLKLQPRAFDASNPAAPQVLKSVPKGRYAVTVIQGTTGQTWRMPNELSPDLAGARGLPPLDSQAFIVEVQ